MSDWLHAGSAEAATFWGSRNLRDSVRQAKTAFCIHNLAYQGSMPLATFPRLCLPDAAMAPLLWPPVQLEGIGVYLCACQHLTGLALPELLKVSLLELGLQSAISVTQTPRLAFSHNY